MKIQKHIYSCYIAIITLSAISACSTEQIDETDIAPGNIPIVLQGALTRTGNGAVNEPLNSYSNLKLTAKAENGTDNYVDYFTNKAISSIGTEDGGKYQLDATVYYPLAKRNIRLYAHTGEVSKDGEISLKAGNELTNDYLVSNGTDGEGTEGNSETQVGLLTFRHIMTQVTVEVNTDTDSGMQADKPKNISFKLKGQKKNGTYNIFTNTITSSDNDEYELGTGTNYLIPTGEKLSDKTGVITSLIIDDYTATETDYNSLTISQAKLNGTNSDFILSPGLAYTLTFNIKRLKVESITVKMTNWNTNEGDSEWDYTPYKVKMNFSNGSGDAYSNSGENQITKFVLHHNGFQYIGEGKQETDNVYAHFVTLPQNMGSNNGMTVDLYTKKGLLIAGHTVTYTAADGEAPASFDIALGSNGMVKQGGYYEVTTPLQFYNMMQNPGTASDKYKLTANIDMNNLPDSYSPPADFQGELDGNGMSIMHLDLAGNGLVTKNSGTLKNIHIASGSITAAGEYAGGLCGRNAGTIEGCINEADIITSGNVQTAGGICGLNENSASVFACLNTGNIHNATTVGGICGENHNQSANAIMACLNTGMLNNKATDLGGICGKQNETTTGNAVINTCYWLTGTARKIQSTSNEAAIGNNPGNATVEDAADLAPERIRSAEKNGAITKLNTILATKSKAWEFKWELDKNGTYTCVWPIPVKKESDNNN